MLKIGHGAVSLEVAAAMSREVRKVVAADYSIAITGIAGPGGGTKNKPVGTVCFGWSTPVLKVSVERMQFSGNRNSIRFQSIYHALSLMLKLIKNET